PLLPARDFKRAADGDAGPNTGGMGAVAPPALPRSVMEQIISQILEPAAAAMAADGCPFVGVLYAGIMLTPTGPHVLEFNCRFGDPETQVILPLLEAPLADALLDVVHGRKPMLRWAHQSAVCVVLASGGYPGQHRTGLPIRGLDAVPEGVMVFHAGTGFGGTDIVTASGRVLNIVAQGASIPQASDRAYAAIGGILFDAMQYRRDIGRAVVVAPTAPAIARGGMRL
ncbi:MAG TPA: phosphoribosylglycinamide synthetase C domain-containing protein, partial [bacterium]|nr:phosphoribosylglycinamide synthetase C domain-containing protein [bacterium]